MTKETRHNMERIRHEHMALPAAAAAAAGRQGRVCLLLLLLLLGGRVVHTASCFPHFVLCLVITCDVGRKSS